MRAEYDRETNEIVLRINGNDNSRLVYCVATGISFLVASRLVDDSFNQWYNEWADAVNEALSTIPDELKGDVLDQIEAQHQLGDVMRLAGGNPTDERPS